MIKKNTVSNKLRNHLKHLPAFYYLKQWSMYFDIHLLSNHRSEWIMPLLTENTRHIKSVTKSSDVGCMKPNKEIYKWVESRIDPVMFWGNRHQWNKNSEI